VVGVREHIYRLYFEYSVSTLNEESGIASLRGRIATNVDNTRGSCTQKGFNYIGMHPGSRGIRNYHVGGPLTGD